MPSNGEHSGRARAHRRRLALAGALACLIALAHAAPAMAVTNLAPPDAPERTGRTLVTENGSWLLASSYSYAWYRCDAAGAGCAQVAGRGGPGYLLTTADIGRRIRSLVTASGALGSESAFSAPTATITAAPPVNQTPPTVSGTARSGSTMSSTLGSWTDPSPGAVSYRRQWQRCTSSGFSCQNIAGATGASYTLRAADVGAFMRVLVSAEGLGTATVESAPAGPVADLASAGGGGSGGGGGGGGGGGSDDTTPAPTGGFRKLRPFPRVVLAGRLLRGRTHVSRLVVTGPRGATVSVRCRGRGCARRSFRARLGNSRRIRLRRFQRTYRPGATIEIRVTGRQAIGKFTRIRIRATRPPSRRDLCLVPGESRPSRCP